VQGEALQVRLPRNAQAFIAKLDVLDQAFAAASRPW